MLQRLDSINRTASEIMGGDLSRRVVISGTQDEFDTLAQNLNAMLDRIERLMRGVQEVADSVAHDLRTPLTRLRNRLETINRHSADNAEVEAAILETDRLIATFNGLLLIAEADAGIVREAMTTVDLASVGEDILELYAPLAEENGIELVLQPSGSITIEGNRSLVSQAMANLVDNAIKYTPKGGKVIIAISERAVGAEISVADTGPGIPAEQRAHVVERFVRLEESRSSPGTGLGLALVAAVSRLHGAVLILEDNKPGLKAIIRFSRSTRPAQPPVTEKGAELAQAS
jgi:signal transduction histidine kinase